MKSGKRMTIVCFVSGSGTNYREIVARDPAHNYLLFTNRPGCDGTAIAIGFGHDVIELSHIPYLKETRKKYGAGNVPRNCLERIDYEREAARLIESKLGRQPDLVCLAGYDQWTSDWLVGRYYPRMLNVHPGDTTKGYDGLHWIPSAKAILAGDKTLRSTLFIVDKGEDTGPVLVQSKALDIMRELRELEAGGKTGLLEASRKITGFAALNNLTTYERFKEKAGEELSTLMERICSNLQDSLKVKGDWKIYPFAVHDLIARGRAAIDGRTVYVDDKKMPSYGCRLD